MTLYLKDDKEFSEFWNLIHDEYELTKKMEYFTNSGGSTKRICFKLPAVLQVVVTTGDGKTGTTTLSAEEGETTTVTCKVN